ncbi:MAG: formylglycine-generating enzyme family protein [Planctomycetaceae bacterium]|nr:formylglycine-generating enzyme family protein [Planctomycetaceae bacterium]
MPPRLKIVAEEILMCGLKSIPVAGKAFEVIDAVLSRHAMLAQGERLEEIELRMSRMDRRLRDLVEEEIRMTLQRLGEPALDGPTLTAEIRNLRSIQQQGWEPTLFEGLLQNSSHWNELKSRPQHYGRVLDAQAMIDPDAIHVLIDAAPLRVLELTPFAFAALLANQSQGVPGAEIQATADIWAFPTSKALISSIGLKLVRIEPGSFQMGTTKEQIDQLLQPFPDSKRERFDDEQPQHRVKITRPFFLGTHPVTQGQFEAIMGSNPSHFKGSDDLPVENVSWLDAVSFCNKMSEKDKRTPFYRINGTDVADVGGNGYRLPTEAEWEYACRAGMAGLFPWGDDIGKQGEHAWFSDNSDGETHPVGQKRPNAWGLYDMLGNVWEWCADWYDEKYFASSPSVAVDPLGPPKASYRVIRGGSWYDARGCRPACRDRNTPENRDYDLGFRVAAVQG